MRMRSAALVLAALLLAGCESYGDLTSDAFDPAGATQGQFTLDAAQCHAKAAALLDGDEAALEVSDGERHEAFNRAFTACMHADGYARHDWSPGIPFPYTVDASPF